MTTNTASQTDEHFDVVVIGGGAAGLDGGELIREDIRAAVAAHRARLAVAQA